MIYGFVGLKGCGKSYACEVLDAEYTFTKVSFAAALKEAAQLLFSFTDEQVYTLEGKEAVDPFWNLTPRWVLQWLGTEVFRNQIHKDFWVKALARKCQNIEGDIFIDDVRFPNEVHWITEAGGKIIHVMREDQECPSLEGLHASESMAAQMLLRPGMSKDLSDLAVVNDLSEDFEKTLLSYFANQGATPKQ